MAVAGRARELLLPLLFLPLAIPIVVGGVGASAGAGGRYLALPRPLRRPLRPARVGGVRVRGGRDLTASGPPGPDYDSPPVKDASQGTGCPRSRASPTALLAVSIALIFFYAPTDADQGLSQRIFYFHVPIALTSYVCFGWGAWKALLHLWKRPRGADLESYVAIHQGVIFGSLTLITGSIWAKISWGVWWAWSDDQLVLFLVLFLFYCGLLHAPLLGRPGAGAGEHVRRLRSLRCRSDPDLVPRDPALEELHPPRRLHLATGRR